MCRFGTANIPGRVKAGLHGLCTSTRGILVKKLCHANWQCIFTFAFVGGDGQKGMSNTVVPCNYSGHAVV